MILFIFYVFWRINLGRHKVEFLEDTYHRSRPPGKHVVLEYILFFSDKIVTHIGNFVRIRRIYPGNYFLICKRRF